MSILAGIIGLPTKVYSEKIFIFPVVILNPLAGALGAKVGLWPGPGEYRGYQTHYCGLTASVDM